MGVAQQIAAEDGGGILLLRAVAVLAIIAGLSLALNIRGTTESFFHRINAGIGFKAHTNPRSLRIVGIGWALVGSLLLLPDLF